MYNLIAVFVHFNHFIDVKINFHTNLYNLASSTAVVILGALWFFWLWPEAISPGTSESFSFTFSWFFLSIPPSVLLFWAVLTRLKHSTPLSAMFVYIHVPPNNPMNARAPCLGPRLSLFSEVSYWWLLFRAAATWPWVSSVNCTLANRLANRKVFLRQITAGGKHNSARLDNWLEILTMEDWTPKERRPELQREQRRRKTSAFIEIERPI